MLYFRALIGGGRVPSEVTWMEKERKEAIINQFCVHDKDTGSTEIQVAVLTERISQLTEH